MIYQQRGFLNTLSGSYGLLNGVGWNSISIISGIWGGGTQDQNQFAGGVTLIGKYVNNTAVGVNVATMLVGAAVNSASRLSVIYSANSSNPNYTPDDQVLMTIRWRG